MDQDDSDLLLTSGKDDWGYLSEGSFQYAGDVSLIEQYQEEEPDASTESDSGQSGSSRKRKGSPLSQDSFDADGPSKRLRRSASSEIPYSEEIHIIAHCPVADALIRRTGLSHGVRYELARLVSSGQLKYTDLTEGRLQALRGPNAEAVARIPEVFFGTQSPSALPDPAFATEIAANSPWQELDKEEEALARGPYEGLGNNPHYPNWYGGKIEFRGRLQVIEDGKSKTFRIQLDPPTLGPSSRCTRRFGSWSFLRVKIPLTAFHNASNQLDLFFQKTFVIWGCVFRACESKGDNVLFYWTDELFPSSQRIKERLSFEEFIEWHNPLAQNSKQLMTKWASRIVLGFSNSVPGPRLEQDCILPEIDIVSEKGSDMTDGCGLSTRNIHRLILNQLSLPNLPTAFQFRLAGYKGMLLLHDDSKNEEGDKVWVRPSQTKIKYPEGKPLDPAMLTIDLLRTPHMRTPSKISTDIIVNLAENGVPHEEFARMLRTSIRELVRGLTTWDGKDAMYDLWTNVERAGGVLTGRRAREAVGEARVRGYSNRSPEDVELEEEEADEDGLSSVEPAVPRSLAWWTDQTSGCPSTLEETVMVLLDTGFCPQNSPILREKLKQVVVKKIEGRTQNLRFEVEQSCTAFAVPDPYGVLGPNEIHVKSSSRNLKTDSGPIDIITGDVLITRNPCKGPCDVRKVKAVDHPALRNYVDIIVFSIKGDRRLIDFLGGGDYDGDIVTVIWALLLVLNFKNAEEKYSVEPQGLDLGFTRQKQTVQDFLEETQSWDRAQRLKAMQVYLLGALCDTSLVGKYSAMHDNAVYEHGYFNPRTVKLNSKFCRVLDSPKTGFKVKPETLKADSQMYSQGLGPKWKAASKKKFAKSRLNTSNTTYTKRDEEKLGRFVMDVLRRAAEKEKDYLLGEMETLFRPLPKSPDPDLMRPWNAALEWAERGNPDLVKQKKRDLDLIASHVQNIYLQHKQSITANAKGKANSPANFTDLPIEVRQDRLRAISRAFQSGPDIAELPTFIDESMVARYRASYAYKFDAEQNTWDGWSRFPWNVAMRDLCVIKAAALGPYKVVMTQFYERFKLARRV
ncbi:hypothetical protein GALMADRAFT_251555 [Galerina marginata CBS 339.88]|uniref:RNA-dependent RNA polymerase n=1 Tax=Galerina marginata (strain CBS 339.88) TaxID=685588 RepID=A0A067SUJ1_GALM3|nr:hypothetical protein GALMADRAFT_251555 [Galerina marginata CBS 339.88]